VFFAEAYKIKPNNMKQTLLFLFISFTTFGQSTVKYGKVEPKDFKTDYRFLDSSAHAVVLYDYGRVTYSYKDDLGFQIETKIHMRIHILNKSEFDRAIIKLPYYRGGREKESISGIKAATYNLLDGKVVESEFSKKDIFDDMVQEDNYQKKLVLPDVKEGSIIEYTYTRSTPFSMSNKPTNWYFQSDLPVLWSQLEAEVPNYFYYQIIMGGYLPLAINKTEQRNIQMGDISGSGMAYNFAVANAPAFKDEPFITTSRDFVSKIEFELSSVTFPNQTEKRYNTTWAELDRTLLESEKWGSVFKNQNFLDSKVTEFKKIADKKERAEAIYADFHKYFKWNETQGLWLGKSLKKIFDDKTGTASELNGLLTAIFKASGLEANPLIISTRGNGRVVEMFPLLDRFNYTLSVLTIDSTKILVDATDPQLPLGMIPEKCLNNLGREITKEGGSFLKISLPLGHGMVDDVTMNIDVEKGMITGTAKSSGQGFHARDLRESFKTLGEAEFIKKLKENNSDYKILSVSTKNLENRNALPEIEFKYEKEEAGIGADIIYLQPLLEGQIKSNPFKKNERKFPVDFGHRTNHVAMSTINVPKGYTVDDIPKPIKIVLPQKGGSFSMITKHEGETIKVVSRLVINTTLFAADDYGALKQFYDEVVNKHSEQIVLKKKTDVK
jgi:hypothetical protein